MREQNARVMGDALANVSNVNVQPGFGVTDYFTVRGFDSLSSGLILTDGAPEPEATYWQLYNVELVEVLKGPGGFLYGSNPLAGTVNRSMPRNRARASAAGLRSSQASTGTNSNALAGGNGVRNARTSRPADVSGKIQSCRSDIGSRSAPARRPARAGPDGVRVWRTARPAPWY